MKAVFFLVLLLQSISAQQDSLRMIYLQNSASAINIPKTDVEKFFSRFFPESGNESSAAKETDTSAMIYFDIVFNPKPEYNISAKLLCVNFNYQIADKNCSNSNRNGILLLEKVQRIAPTKKESEKINKTAYVLIPDKCSTTRFYNAKGDMFCDNKRQYSGEYDEGKSLEENLRVRVGIQLLTNSRGDFYDKTIPAEVNYPVENHLKEYVLRCCIRSIVILKGNEIIDNFVSLK